MNKLYPPGPQPGVKGRLKNHYRKFWWCDCLVLVVVVLVIVLPLIFVGIPNIAQNAINKSTLEVTSQEVTSPTSDSVQLQMDTVIRSDSSFHPTIDGFRAALSLKDQPPFVHIDIPQTKSESETKVTVNQDVKFDSLDAFTGYTKAVLASDTYEVFLNGKTTLHLSGLPSMDVDYNKVVTLKGLNKLNGLNITDLKILSGQNEILPDGSNLIGTVHIPNPSVMTLDLGNVTMDLSVDNESIGYTLIPNLILKPGDNQLPMQSHVEQLTILSLVQSKYKDAILPLDIVGNSSISNGQHLTYYEDAIKGNQIRLNLNIASALQAIGLNITSSASA